MFEQPGAQSSDQPTSTPSVATPAELHQHPDSIFVGRYGLRAGWGMLIFIVTAVLIMALASIFAVASTGHMKEVIAARAYAQAHPGAPKPKLHLDFVPRFVIVNDAVNFFGLLGVCWFFHKGERRPLRAYGIGGYRVADVLPGAFWGLAMLSGVVGVLWASHLLVFDGVNVHGMHAVIYGIGWLVAFLFVGFSEEYTFRGYLQYTLTRGLIGLAERIAPARARIVAFWMAAAILSGLFAFAHIGNGGETAFGLVQVFLAGVTFAYALWRTGSLWWAIGFHMTWDWAQSFLFGVADSGNVSVGRLFVTHPQGRTILSGGTTGPEGSIFASAALLLTLLIIRLQRPGMQPALEQEPRQPLPPAIPEFHNPVA